LCLRFRETFVGSRTFIYFMREMKKSLQRFVLLQAVKGY